MTLPRKPIMVRLSPELGAKFEALQAEFPGLPQAMLIRFLLTSVLDRNLDDQVKTVNRVIRGHKSKENWPANRIGGTNSKRPI
ncbi:MAG: hypothetical protein M5U26_12570 [Planctomycetota bacterium]|nr:hypothetical protein [Planctomycetota bacterium]